MLIRFIGAAVFVTFSLLFAGCYGAAETDDVAYIMVIGIDKAEDGKLNVTYQTAVPRALSGSDPSGMGLQNAPLPQTPWIINTLTIPTLAEAHMLLNSTMSRTPNSNHVIAYIFSEELAREGLAPSLSYIIRSRDFRETIYFIVVQGNAEEYIKRNKPTLETTIVRFYESFFLTASVASYYLPGTLHNFYTTLKNSGGSPYTAYSGINPMTGEDQPAGSKTAEQKGDPYLPGGTPRTGTEDPVEFLGLAVFRGDKMVGVLNSDETIAVAILQGKYPQGYVDVIDPLQPEKDYINLKVRSEQVPKVTVTFNGDVPVFDIKIAIDAEILGIFSGINYEAPVYRELLEAQISNMFKEQILSMLKHTQALGSDPVGFGLYLRPQFRNTAELDLADTLALYQTANFHVNVTAKIRRTGLLWRTTPVKKE